MIDEKKLILALLKRHREVQVIDGNYLYEEVEIICNEICNVISIINEQPKTDWIPCEERLPNKGVLVLAQYHRWSDGFDKIVIAYIRDDDEWKIDLGGVCNQNSIIAWQPLPQPYKKEGAE